MEKRMILAVVLSVLIVVVGMIIPGLFTNPAAPSSNLAPTASTAPNNLAQTDQTKSGTVAPAPTATGSTAVQVLDPTKPPKAMVVKPAEGLSNSPITYNNGKLLVTFDPRGARISSIQIPEYTDQGGSVQMLYPSPNGGLTTRFGGRDGQEMTEPFLLTQGLPAGIFEFYRDYQINDTPTKSIRVIKRYSFQPNDFVFRLDIRYVYSVNEELPDPGNNTFYTLALEPQIGPLSTQINNTQDYRNFVYLIGDSRQQPGLGPGNEQVIKDKPKWLAIDGKYFAVFFVPPSADSKITLTTHSLAGGTPGNQLYFSRTFVKSAQFEDSWHIYAGPKIASVLEKYNKTDDNPSRLQDLRFDQIAGTNILAWLETILKAIMQGFVHVIPNWGVAIILLTILVKLALFPLSHRAAKSTYRMQALQPKIMALREKYKDNPQKMNQEMAAVYQKEKINPLGGCLPLLLQFPFFFAMYSLFNTDFDLRGAMFIPGWINDLSQPETIIKFQMSLPLMPPITGLHLLPIFYVASQILTTKLTQVASPGSSPAQMKFLMYGLPIIFFFILYEVPSGLLVYWIFQNILQLFQQLLVNNMLKKNQPEPNSNSKPNNTRR